MSTFPTAKDSFVNPTPTTPKNDPAVPLSSAISRLNSAVVAIQDTVGITGSVDPASIQYRLADAQAVAAAADEAISAHVVAGDPHPQYTTQTEVLTLAPAETGSTIGALVVAGADVTSPQDVDLIALSVSSVLRKFSWANMRAALAQIFPLLAGASGGQTINGGTTAGQNLTLRSTAHATKGAIILGDASEYDEANNRLGIGTLTPAAKVHSLATTEQLRLGYDASNYYSVTVSSSGAVTHEAKAAGRVAIRCATSLLTAATGSELVVNGAFSSDLSAWADSGASWSWSAGTALHTAGSVSNISQVITTVVGATYQIEFVISGRTAGSVSVDLGGVSVVDIGSTTAIAANGTYKRTLVAGSSGSVPLTFAPTSDFNGAIDSISVKLVTLNSSTPHLQFSDSSDQVLFDIRSGQSGSNNAAAGKNALSSMTAGTNNAAFGFDAASNLTTGGSSTAFGYRALFAATVGRSNSAFGAQALSALTTGIENVGVGSSSAGSLTTGSTNVAVGNFSAGALTSGSKNTAVGHAALRNTTTQSNDSAFGYQAGRYIADGISALTSATNCTYIGASTRASADAVTNENVFGFDATGIGSNSCVIGSSAVTKCQIFGDIILDKTVTAAGTTGAQTINKTVGSVNFAAGATSLVVTNNRVTTASIIVATVATNDATMKTVLVVAAAGSFTIHANAAATAETRVNFIVIN